MGVSHASTGRNLVSKRRNAFLAYRESANPTYLTLQFH